MFAILLTCSLQIYAKTENEQENEKENEENGKENGKETSTPNGKVVQAATAAIQAALNSFVDTTEDGCIMCQYYLQRISNNVRAAGVLPTHVRARVDRNNDAQKYGTGVVTSEFDPTYTGLRSLIELSSTHKQKQKQIPYPPRPWMSGANAPMGIPIDSSQEPGYRNFFSQVERVLFTQIFHIMDLTMDDACEEATPNEFYKHCQAVLDKQDLVVQLVSREFKPEDICFRIKQCTPASYSEIGIHSVKRNRK